MDGEYIDRFCLIFGLPKGKINKDKRVTDRPSSPSNTCPHAEILSGLAKIEVILTGFDFEGWFLMGFHIG